MKNSLIIFGLIMLLNACQGDPVKEAVSAELLSYDITYQAQMAQTDSLIFYFEQNKTKLSSQNEKINTDSFLALNNDFSAEAKALKEEIIQKMIAPKELRKLVDQAEIPQDSVNNLLIQVRNYNSYWSSRLNDLNQKLDQINSKN